MLSDALIAIGVEILQFFNWMLSFFNLPYINKMTDAIQWAVGMIYTLNNTFPVTTLFECMTVLLLCWIFKFQIKLVFETILPMIPFIGKRRQHTTILPSYQTKPRKQKRHGKFLPLQKTQKIQKLIFCKVQIIT